MAYEVADFHKEVIERSYTTPVLVDFWAPWCAPCRILGPVLEKLAAENTGRWKLAKVNTDENQQISVQYGIRGIPAVKLFVEGEVVNEFTGALPEHAVRRWLDESLPSQEKMQLEAAMAAMEAGQVEMAVSLLQGLLAAQPDHIQARVMLAQATAQEDPASAVHLLEGVEITDPSMVSTAEAIQELGRLLTYAKDGAVLPDEAGRESYRAAIDAVSRADWDAALKAFIEVIQQNRYYDDDGSRKACIAIFSLLGTTHELTRKHRRIFDMVLY